MNGVFLIALCLSIFLDAIQRFAEPQEVKNPKIVLIVGAVGLAFNIIGLFVFHEHSHSHDHGEEGHSHADELSEAEAGHGGHAHGHDHAHKQADGAAKKSAQSASPTRTKSLSWGDDSGREGEHAPLSPSARRQSSARRPYRHSRSGSRGYNTVDDIPVHPASLRNGILAQARFEESDTESEVAVEDQDAITQINQEPTEVSSLLPKSKARRSSNKRKSHTRSKQDGNANDISHANHKHTQPRSKAQSGGHSHADMNLRGILIHVLGDALGNVGVMVSALIIWKAPWSFRKYCDPAISLFITLIILKSAIPLVKDTAKPLLQAVPGHISVEDIKEDIESLPGVRECHHVHVWALTPSKLIATLDVNLDFDFQERQGATRWMQLAEEIKSCLHAYGIHSSTIQPEFCTNEEHEHVLKTTLNNMGGTTNEQSSTVDGATTGNAGAAAENSVSSDGHGACLLNCNETCATGKQCCGPPSAAGSGTVTPRRQADKDEHNHDHGKHDHGKHDHGKHDHGKHDQDKHGRNKHDH